MGQRMDALQREWSDAWPTERPVDMPEREWEILRRHAQGRETFQQIARDYGVSAVRIAQLAHNAAYRLWWHQTHA